MAAGFDARRKPETQEGSFPSGVFSHGRELRLWLYELFPEIDDHTLQRAREPVCIALETYFQERGAAAAVAAAPPPKEAWGSGPGPEPNRGAKSYSSRKGRRWRCSCMWLDSGWVLLTSDWGILRCTLGVAMYFDHSLHAVCMRLLWLGGVAHVLHVHCDSSFPWW